MSRANEPPEAHQNIVLIGLRCSGKTTVGRLLAQRTGWDFVDTDEWVRRRAGCSIRDLFELGEERFRELESAALSDLGGRRRTVIAVGGGAVQHAAHHALLAGLGTIVWLRAEPAVLYRRQCDDPATAESRPPLVAGGGIDEIHSLLALRAPQYQALADHQVDTTGLAPHEVAGAILAMLGGS